MPLQKQSVKINFAQGLDQKTDPLQVPIGKFSSLINMSFNKVGRLTKRDGFEELPSLPDSSSNFLTTFNGNLTAVGENLNAFSQGSGTWASKGSVQPCNLSTLSLIRSNTNQSQVDTALSQNGLMCVVFTDNVPSGGSNTIKYKYSVLDSTTGQKIINPTLILPSSGVVTYAPKVFVLGNYFVIVFTTLISGTYHLQYVAISTVNPANVNVAVNISSQITPSSQGAFDGVVVNNSLFLAWNGSDLGGAIRVNYLDSTLVLHGANVFTGKSATLMALCADLTQSTTVVYVSFWDTATSDGYVLAVNQSNTTVLSPTLVISSEVISNLTVSAQNSVASVFYEKPNAYSYDSSIATNFVKQVTCSQSGSVGSSSVVVRSVGLGSKSFVINGSIYFVGAYSSQYQPGYYVLNSSGQVICKLAYQNGGGYYTTGLPSVNVDRNVAAFGYLIKDLIQSVNKNTNTPTGTQVNGIYSQTGINLAYVSIGTSNIIPAEIANNLNFSGGFLWNYDGETPVENNFFLYPENIEVTGHSTGGGLKAQKYFIQATYQWTDAQGNIQESAPSIPVEIDLSNLSPTPITFTSTFSSDVSTITVSSTTGLFVGQYITDNTTPTNIQANTYITSINGSDIGLSLPTAAASGSPDTLQTVDTCSLTENVPNLRLTYKTANPVKIVFYRWSVDQETYYQSTSIFLPILNSTTTDSTTVTDTASDFQILGNSIIYTNGGVVENISPPSFSSIALWQSRLWGINSEDNNLLSFSKQAIENVTIEMSDLFTLYVPPSTSGVTTGPMKCIFPMDDKFIIFKANALEYIAGSGPDNTGSNNQFSDPMLIASTVGCTNQQSIALTPNGLMFQSDKGIWILYRNLATEYIGKDVEDLTLNATVLSAINVPETNEVRFTMSSGLTLVYDYFVGQWAVHSEGGISSTVYNGLHTYLDSQGNVFQQTPGKYLDGSKPVLMSFTTSWINMMGLQDFQRVYFMYLLGQFYSPHKLNVQVSYDYFSPTQSQYLIFPDNYNVNYGVDPVLGSGTPFGGNMNVEQWRVDFEQQQCQAIQISVSEQVLSINGSTAGQGCTLSGLNLIIGAKDVRPRLPASRITG